MSRFTYAARSLLLILALPVAILTGLVYAITDDRAFSLLVGIVSLLPFTGLWIEVLGEYVPVPVDVALMGPPMPVIAEVPGGLRISAEIDLAELPTHRRSVHRDGGTIVCSSPIGHGNRFLVTAHYPEGR